MKFRRTWLTLATLLVAAAIAANPASASKVQLLQPSGPWKIEYADVECILSRPFAGDGHPYNVQLTTRPVTHRSWFRIRSMERKTLRTYADGDTRVAVDGMELRDRIHFSIFPDSEDAPVREFRFDDFERTAGGARATLGFPLGQYGNFTLNVPDLHDAVAAFQACRNDLNKSLGVDDSVLTAIAVAPKGSALEFARLPYEPYELHLLYWVSPDGRVDECHLIKPSGNADLDKRICSDIMKNARLKPARNAAGVAIRAPVYQGARLQAVGSGAGKP